MKVLALNWGRFCPPGDIWQYLEMFWFITSRGVGNAIGIQWVEARIVGKHPVIQKTGPPLQLPKTKNYLAPNVSGAETLF